MTNGNKKQKMTVQRAMLRELQEMRDSITAIEEQTKHLKPASAGKRMAKEFTYGVVKGIGLFVGGVIIVTILAVIAQKILTSDSTKQFIENQLQDTISSQIEDFIPEGPF